MKNEILDSIIYDIKNKPVGYIVGGILGYFVAKKIPIPFISIPMIIAGALFGSKIENKLSGQKTPL